MGFCAHPSDIGSADLPLERESVNNFLQLLIEKQTAVRIIAHYFKKIRRKRGQTVRNSSQSAGVLDVIPVQLIIESSSAHA